MSERKHLLLCDRKVLCGRTLVLRALAPHKARAIAGGAQGSFEEAMTSALNRVTEPFARAGRRAEAVRGEDPRRLDAYLRAAADEVLKLPTMGDPVLGPLLQTAAASLRAVNCEDCAGGPAVCNNLPERDDPLIDGRGDCLKHFRALLDHARRCAEELYQAHAPGFAAFPKPVLSFRTRFNPAPHRLGKCRYINGATAYDDGGGALGSVVVLDLAALRFDYDSLLATGYVLFHECICHVYNGARPGSRPRRSTDPEDRFAEGWMDRLAMDVYREAVAKAPSDLLSSRALDAALELHRARYDQDNPQSTESERGAAACRSIGAEAAGRLLEFLTKLYGDPEPAQSLFRRLSLDWNVERDLAPLRQKFVAGIDASLTEGNLPNYAAEKRLADCVEAYRRSSNLADFAPLWADPPQ